MVRLYALVLCFGSVLSGGPLPGLAAMFVEEPIEQGGDQTSLLWSLPRW